MTEYQWMCQIRERIRRFKSIPGVRLPLYESHAGVDFGRYLGIIREDEQWKNITIDLTRSDFSPLAEERADIAQHIVRSLQEIEDLIHIVERLSIENRILKDKLRMVIRGNNHQTTRLDVIPAKAAGQDFPSTPRMRSMV